MLIRESGTPTFLAHGVTSGAIAEITGGKFAAGAAGGAMSELASNWSLNAFGGNEEYHGIWDTHLFDRGVESRPGSLPVSRASMRCRAKSRALAPPPPVASLYPQLRHRQQVSR
ncbi:hypothetical protein CHH34_00005 [Aeromonas veronii]|nr:hypothetical protein CHF44_01945 [Aeromonas veronii]RDU94307.1 hypothetical protein CHH34_00005 [Aeromonas veronii]TEY69425.1 hypothetical protein CIG15_01945 [Aeromonas veronii]